MNFQIILILLFPIIWQLWNVQDFPDVTLAQEDNQLQKAHKVILMCDSINNHTHPLIYVGGSEVKPFKQVGYFPVSTT